MMEEAVMNCHEPMALAEGSKLSIMKPGRVLSLDAFRGLAIILMLLANNQGDESHVFPALLHAEWFGCTLADLGASLFIFIMGAALPMSIGGQLDRGESKEQIFIHALRRASILAILGISLKALDWFVYREFFRLYGVLQRIAIVYLCMVIIILIFPRRLHQAGIAVGLLLLYLLILSYPFNASYGPGELPILPEKYNNIVDATDTWIFGDSLYNYDRDLHMGHDPEGLLSTIPSISTGLAGVLCSYILLCRRIREKEKVVYLAIAGIALIAGGILSQGIIPFCANLWTPSYVLYTAGISCTILILLYWAIDMRGLIAPAVIMAYGQNPLPIYIAAESIPDIFDAVRWTGPDGNTQYLTHYLIDNLLSSWAVPLAGPYIASALLGILYLIVFGALALWLYEKRIYIKI